MTRGVAPLLLGYLAFDKEIQIAGVILNKLGGDRHESKLREIITHYTDIPLIGAVHQDSGMEIDERHLGLIPSNEAEHVEAKLQWISDRISQQVDLNRLLNIADSASNYNTSGFIHPSVRTRTSIRIGIAQDSAFGFYYAGDLEALKKAGAELIYIDTINDASLPDIDGLFIGGGFPETHAEKLASNSSLLKSIKSAIENGLPCYAECGGMMYLTRSLRWKDKLYPMVGALPADTIMNDRPQGRGYVKLKPESCHPWTINLNPTKNNQPDIINAHEFHYSSLVNIESGLKYAYQVVRGHGINGKQDGLIYKNVLANYSHLRDVSAHHWADQFITFVSNHKIRQVNEKLSAVF